MEHFGQSGAGKGPWQQVTVMDFRLGRCLSADGWQVLRKNNGMSVPGNVKRCWFPFWVEEGKERAGFFISRRFLCAPT